MAKYECKVCRYIYNEQQAGRPFEELSECPICNESKENFAMLEEEEVFFEWADEDDEDIVDAQVRPVEDEPEVAADGTEKDTGSIPTVIEAEAKEIVEEEKTESTFPQASDLAKNLTGGHDINTEYVVERRQEFWSPFSGSKTEKNEQKSQSTSKAWSIENAYASVERVLDLNGNEVKTDKKEEEALQVKETVAVATADSAGEESATEKEDNFRPLWESGAGMVQRVIEPLSPKAENVYAANSEDVIDYLDEEDEEEKVLQATILEDAEEDEAIEETVVPKEETSEEQEEDVLDSLAEAVAEAVGDELVTEETDAEETAAEETGTEEVAAEETDAEEVVAEETDTEEAVTEEAVTEEAVTEEAAAEETAAEETDTEEVATEEVAAEETAAEETDTEEVATEEVATEEVAAEETDTEEAAEEAAAEETDTEETDTEETDAEDTYFAEEVNSIIEDAITAEDLLLDKEMLEDIVTELPEDELIITPEPVEEEEEENVEEEVVEEAEEEVEEQRFDFADLDDVEDANAEVEEILIDNPLSEENTRSYGPNMNAVSNNAVRDDFLAKEFGAPFAAGAAVAAGVAGVAGAGIADALEEEEEKETTAEEIAEVSAEEIEEIFSEEVAEETPAEETVEETPADETEETPADEAEEALTEVASEEALTEETEAEEASEDAFVDETAVTPIILDDEEALSEEHLIDESEVELITLPEIEDAEGANEAVKEPVALTCSNQLENIMILPAQLSPMPLDERAVVETSTIIGIGAQKPMKLQTPVQKRSAKNILEYIPNNGLTSEDFMEADAIEIIVGRGDGIEKTISSKEDLRQAVAFLRLEGDGCPIGIKMAAGRLERDLEFCVFAKPDFVVLNNFSVVPLPYALYRAKKYLNTVDADLDLMVELKDVADADEVAKIVAMGADVIILKDSDKDMEELTQGLVQIAKETGHYDVSDLNVRDLCTTNRDIAQYTDIYHV